MMNVTLATSLHVDHGTLSRDQAPGDAPPMQSFVPIGLLSLKSAAAKAGVAANIRVTELNGLINQGRIPNDELFYERLIDAFVRKDDDLVGLMTDADSLPHTVILAQRIRERFPYARIALGGPASSPISRQLLERFKFIDYIVRGEGDVTFPELLRALNQESHLAYIAGLTWRGAGEVHVNTDRPVLDNLDELPIPEFVCEGVTASSSLYLDVGRGCPFRCRFCATAPFWSRRYRMKSTGRIIDEMSIARDRYGRRHVNFSHDIFTCDRQWTLGFCEQLRQANLQMTWSCSTRTDITDREVVENLASAGCVEIYYGIETGSANTQHFIDKNLNLEWSRQVVSATAAVGIRAITGFIVGHPNESQNSLADTLKLFFEFLELGKGRSHLFTLCPFHQSPMFGEYSKTIDRPAEYGDIALVASLEDEHEGMKAGHRDIFASLYRYATPGVPAKLIDASEEISCHLVVLKALWPLLLPHYESPLEWYTRWVDWVERHNATARPRTPLTHQGNAYDLLEFSRQELSRLGLAESPLADLVRYEEAKLDARALGAPETWLNEAKESGTETLIRRQCDYIACPVTFDMKALLSERVVRRFPEGEQMWVVVAKTGRGSIDTLQINNAGKSVLDLLSEPQHSEGLEAALSEAGIELDDGVRLIQKFCDRGLLCEVTA
jgi:radical SAM superfamily enzyme YgiQ (UPF0313 family)